MMKMQQSPNPRDPCRYVDAQSIPYVVLHPKALKFARLGDFAVVMNRRNGKFSAAIVADESVCRIFLSAKAQFCASAR